MTSPFGPSDFGSDDETILTSHLRIFYSSPFVFLYFSFGVKYVLVFAYNHKVSQRAGIWTVYDSIVLSLSDIKANFYSTLLYKSL